jgi:hypothetical protein
MRRLPWILLILSLATSSIWAEESEDLASFTLIPKLSLLSPNIIQLSNNNFNVPSNNNVQGFPLINVLVSKHWFTFAGLDVEMQGGLGYGFRQQTVSLQTGGGPVVNDMGLHVLPISASFKGIYNIPHFSGVRPGLEIGGGMYWLIQNASASLANDAFWLPFLRISPSLTFFESSYEKGDWWGGFCFGISYQSSIAGRGTFQAWSFDLSTNILL